PFLTRLPRQRKVEYHPPTLRTEPPRPSLQRTEMSCQALPTLTVQPPPPPMVTHHQHRRPHPLMLPPRMIMTNPTNIQRTTRRMFRANITSLPQVLPMVAQVTILTHPVNIIMMPDIHRVDGSIPLPPILALAGPLMFRLRVRNLTPDPAFNPTY